MTENSGEVRDGLEILFPNPDGIRPPVRHREAFDVFMQEIPISDIFDGAQEYGEKRPLIGLSQLIDSALDHLQAIPAQVNAFAFSGGILKAVLEQYPERIAQLDPEQQAIVQEIAGRLGDVPTK